MNYDIFQYQIAGNTLSRYIYFITIFAGSILALKFFRIIIFSRIKNYAESSGSKIDDLVVTSFQKNILPAMYIALLYISSGVFDINNRIDKWVNHLFLITVAFFITRFIVSLVIFFVNRYWLFRRDENEGKSISVVINTVIKIVLWTVSILIIMDNVGLKVSGLVAGLGVSGVAIAFAAQSILRDIFNYFTIFFDRPFEIGDFLIVDKFAGTVEHIGVKTTRIRSLGGELLIFANTDLTGSRVRNYKSMYERRVLFNFGVTYQTPVNKIKKIPGEIKKIVEEIGSARFDRAHFQKFGDSSLDFEVVYYVLSKEYNTYMDIQQDINIKIMLLLEKMKVEFAYPTRTVYTERLK